MCESSLPLLLIFIASSQDVASGEQLPPIRICHLTHLPRVTNAQIS
jgi:hypothetical protein